jgi:hypothetical protein
MSVSRTAFVTLLAALLLCGGVKASGPFQANTLPSEAIGPPLPVSEQEPRVGAAVLAVVLGPFGAHRLYLGTSPKVAVIYGLTFGGFGVLPLIDLGHLLFAADQERFRNNDRLLMWRAPRKEAITPP